MKTWKSSELAKALDNVINRIFGPLFTSGRDPLCVSVGTSPKDFEALLLHNRDWLDFNKCINGKSFGSTYPIISTEGVPNGRVRITLEVNL